MKKALVLLIVIISMFVMNVYAEPTTWPHTFTYGEYEYQIEGVSLKVYQQRIETDDEGFDDIVEEDQTNYINENPTKTINLNPSDFTINPEHREDKLSGHDALYIDLNLNITKEKLVELLQDEITNTTDNKHYLVELSLNYRLLNTPSQYPNIYKINFIREVEKIFTNSQLPVVNKNESLNQVFNVAITSIGEDTNELLYENTITDENGIGSALLNYLVFSDSPITAAINNEVGFRQTDMPDSAKMLMFYNIDNIDYLIENLKEIEEEELEELDDLENPETDIVEEVKVPNTAQRVQIYLFILGFTFVLIGLVPMTYILYNNQKKKQEV